MTERLLYKTSVTENFDLASDRFDKYWNSDLGKYISNTLKKEYVKKCSSDSHEWVVDLTDSEWDLCLLYKDANCKPREARWGEGYWGHSDGLFSEDYIWGK